MVRTVLEVSEAVRPAVAPEQGGSLIVQAFDRFAHVSGFFRMENPVPHCENPRRTCEAALESGA
jgi:hypothetical protein